jgi:methyl-accepting chemotaxis protein
LILLARIATKPLGGEPRSMALLADSVAEGKLATDSGEATTCHGAYGSMLRMKARLREIVAGVTAAGNEVAATAERIASSSTGLAVRTESQAASLEQTAASLEQMTSTVQQSAENSAQASQLAKAAGDEAEHGGEVAAKAVEAMNTISHASRKIGDIISVIDSIAFQTNLLALNAAVEAARAGDQGRGFAVVAGEVRTLAQRSAQAADEIKVLITDTVNKVEDGSRLVNESGAALEMIVESVKKVSAFSTEIASASQEQALGIDQISTAVTQMDQSTQQNAALVEQTTTASAALGRQAQELSRLMEFFDTGDANGAAATEGGKNRCVMPPPASQAQPEKPKVVLVKSDRESTAGNCRGQLHFDFSSARSKHLAWKPRLRGFLDGNGDLTEAEAISHRDCDFGKWLYARGLKDFGHLRQMQKLERIHEQMHRQVKILVQAKNAGDTKRANVILDEVGKLSERVVELLHIVEHETTQEREAPATRRLAAGGESWEAF